VAHKYVQVCLFVPIPAAARSKALACGSSRAGIAGSNPAWRMYVSVSCECCVLSGRGFCDGSNARPEEFYLVWCV
jgi:hypothetical protein